MIELRNDQMWDALFSVSPILRQIGMRAHPKVLLVRYAIYAKVKRWDACVDIANAVVAEAPSLAEGWINRSFALHELKRTQEALDKLLSVAGAFPEVWTIPYNLACYACQLGRCDLNLPCQLTKMPSNGRQLMIPIWIRCGRVRKGRFGSRFDPPARLRTGQPPAGRGTAEQRCRLLVE